MKAAILSGYNKNGCEIELRDIPVPDISAAVPLTALTALQSYELMGLKKGDKLFISGGTGSVGAMAIPIAKSLGATIYTNGSGDNEERVRSLGVDRFINYKKEDYAEILSDVDCVLDTLGERELTKELTILKQGGSIVSLRAMPNGEFAKRSDMCAVKQFVFKIAETKRFAKTRSSHEVRSLGLGCVPNEPVQKLAKVRIGTLLAKY